MRYLSAATLISLNLLSSNAIAETTTSVFGPVELHKGSRFELCTNARYATNNVQVTASFFQVENGKLLEPATVTELDSGQGECFVLPFERAGKATVFATLEAFGEPGDTNLVANAAIINGVFEVPVRQQLAEDDGVATATTFGPLTIHEGKRLKVCANNWRSAYPLPVSVNFYSTRDASEPFLVTNSELEPGEGGCTTISQEVTGEESIFAELRTEPVEKGFSNPLPATGAFVVNGIFFAPLPAELRYLPQE